MIAALLVVLVLASSGVAMAAPEGTMMLRQIQQIMVDRVLHVPIYELAFLWGIGPRVEEAAVDHIKGFSYSAPYEDLKLKPGR
jgi:peptide/nickel transport system substrate-binding protein